MARSTDDPKRVPKQRVSRVTNQNLIREGFVSLTGWGIPEPPRSGVWTGARCGRWKRADRLRQNESTRLKGVRLQMLQGMLAT